MANAYCILPLPNSPLSPFTFCDFVIVQLPAESTVISLSPLNMQQPQIHHSEGFIENAVMAKQQGARTSCS